MSRRRMGSYDGSNFVPIEHYNKLADAALGEVGPSLG